MHMRFSLCLIFIFGILPISIWGQASFLPCGASVNPEDGWGSETESRALSGDFFNGEPWVTDLAGGIQTFGVADADSSVFYKLEVDPATRSLVIEWRNGTATSVNAALFTVSSPECGGGTDYGENLLESGLDEPLLAENVEQSDAVRWDLCALSSAERAGLYLWLAVPPGNLGTFELGVTQQVAPTNDDCENIRPLGEQPADETQVFCLEGSNEFACPENYDPAILSNPNDLDRTCFVDAVLGDRSGVWFEFETPADAGRFDLDLEHFNEENVNFTLFEPDPDCSSMIVLYCEKDLDSDGIIELENYDLEPDKTYWILIHTEMGEEQEGSFELCLNVKPPISCDSLGPSFFNQTIVNCEFDQFEATCLSMPEAHPDGPFRFPGCFGENMENPTWFTFVADDDVFEINLDILECANSDGVQLALYELSCETQFNPLNRDGTLPDPGDLISNCLAYVFSPQTGPTTFAAMVEPGNVYGFLIDGFDGDQCDVYIEEVISGGGQHTLDDEDLADPVLVDGDFEFDGDTICAGATDVMFELPEPMEEACLYIWTQDGFGNPDSDRSTTEVFDFPAPGTYEICVRASTLCDQTTPNCIEVEVVELEPYFTIDTICEGDDYIWTGPYGNELTPTPDLNTDIPGSGTYTSTANNAAGCYVPAELQLFIRDENDENPTVLDTFACYDDASSGNFTYICEELNGPGTYEQSCLSPTTGCDSFFVIDLFVFGGPFSIEPVCNGEGGMGFFFADPELGGYTPWFEQLGRLNSDDSFTVDYNWTIQGTEDTLGRELNLILDQATIEDLATNGVLTLQMEITILYRDELYCSSRETYSFVLEEHFPQILGFTGDTAYCRGSEELELSARIQHPTNPTPMGQSDSISDTQWYLPDSFDYVPPSDSSADTIQITPPDTLRDGTLCFTVYTERCAFTDSLCLELEEVVPLEPDLGPDIERCDSSVTLDPLVASQGVWRMIDSPGSGDSLLIDNPENPNTSISATGRGTYTLEWREGLENCPKFDTITVSFLPPPSASNILDTCIGLDFVAIIDIIGGEGGYTIDPSSDVTGTIDSNQFVSDTIAIDPDGNFGDTLYLVVTDSAGCTSDSIPILLRCGCESTAGEMSTDTLALCDGETAVPVDLDGRNIEDSDTVMYILHTGMGNQLGTILDTSLFEDGVFDFDPDYTYGQVYYISAVVGDGAGGGLVDLSDPCLAVASGQPVIWRETPLANAGSDAESCALEYNLFATISAGTGEWTVLPDTGNVSFNNPSQANTLVSVGSPGTYTFRWAGTNGNCIDDDEVEITFYEPLSYRILYECNASATEYRAFIILEGGSGMYTEITNEGSFSNDTLIIDWLPAGELRQVQIDDESICDPLDIDVVTECVCQTEIGTLDTSQVLTACLEDCIDASGRYDPTGEFLDGNDVAGYVLHNTNDTLLGSEVLGQSADGTFCYTDYSSDIQPGDTFFVAYIIGDDSGNGEVQLDDDCLKVSYGIPLVFFDGPDADAGADATACNLMGTLEGILPPNASGNWTYESGPSATVSIANPGQPVTAVEVEDLGLHTWIWTVSQNGCSASDTVAIDFVSAPEVDLNSLEIDCDADGENYTLTFDILGGQENSLVVEGSSGELMGRSFTSDPIPEEESYNFIVFDGFQCDSFFLDGDFTCDCITEIGALEGSELHLCEDESVTDQISYDTTGEMRDGNDELRFVLLAQDETILMENETVDFSFDPGSMNLGETYYIRVYLGSVINGEFMYDESCTQQDGDIAVTWWAYPEAVAEPTADEFSCSLSSIDIDGGNSIGQRLQFEWSTADGQIESGADDPLVTVTSQGTYLLIVRDSLSGCSDSTAIEIGSSSDLPEVVIETPGLLTCADSTVVLDGSGSTAGGNIEYLWTSGNGNITGPTDEATTRVNAAGMYTLTVRNTDNDCEASRSVEVEEDREPPTVVIQPSDTLSCATTEVELSAAGSSEGASIRYAWSTTDGNISGNSMQRDIIVTEPGSYQLIVTNQENGCVDSATIDVIRAENELGELEIDSRPPDCFGESTGEISVSTDGGAEPIQYQLIGGSENQTGIFEDLSAGEYEIVVTDANGCSQQDTVTLAEGEEVQLELGASINVDPGDSVILEATILAGDGPFTYFWDTDTLTYECLNADCSIIRFLPLVSMTVSVAALSELDCEAGDDTQIILRDRGNLFIPNVFSPNGDGINDFFLPEGGQNVQQIDEMQIFDRWGNLHFEQRNFMPGETSAGWSGRSKGEILSPGVYVYRVKVTYNNDESEHLHGTVTLVR